MWYSWNWAWQGTDWLIEGMRIDKQALQAVSRAQIDALIGVYKQKSPGAFLCLQGGGRDYNESRSTSIETNAPSVNSGDWGS